MRPMKITKKTDVFILINRLQKILKYKPSHDQMLKEVQMMKFKIRPVLGDISLLNFKNIQLIEALWGLGKLDDFFKIEYRKVGSADQKTFIKIVDQIRGRLENQLGAVSFKKPVNIPQAIEMEIFKEYPRKKN